MVSGHSRGRETRRFHPHHANGASRGHGASRFARFCHPFTFRNLFGLFLQSCDTTRLWSLCPRGSRPRCGSLHHVDADPAFVQADPCRCGRVAHFKKKAPRASRSGPDERTGTPTQTRNGKKKRRTATGCCGGEGGDGRLDASSCINGANVGVWLGWSCYAQLVKVHRVECTQAIEIIFGRVRARYLQRRVYRSKASENIRETEFIQYQLQSLDL